MSAKIDINEVEARTKIRAKYLRAMENEEWDLLPGEVYVRSFLRTYGDFLGLDSRALVDDFRRGYENPAEHEPPPIAPPSRDQRDRQGRQRQRQQQRGGRGGGLHMPGVPPWVIVGVVLLVIIVVLVIVGTHNNSSQHDTTPHTTAAGHPHHHRRAHHHKKVTPKVPPKPTSVSLALTASGPSDVYVCLVNGAGKVLIPGRTYTPGETIPTEVGRRLLLTLGNDSVTVKANGVTVPVQASATSIGLKFTPGAHHPLAAAAQPTCAP